MSNLKGSISKVSKYFYQNKDSVVITGGFWKSDTDYVNNISPVHTGYDYRARTPLGIVSPNYGEVIQVVNNSKNGKDQGYGTYVMVYYPTWNVTFLCGHMSKLNVKKGQTVRIGDLLGYTGNTGHSTGAHLHVSLIKGKTININKEEVQWLDVERFDFVNLNHYNSDLNVGSDVVVNGNLYTASNGKTKGKTKHANKKAVIIRVIEGANAGYLVKGSGVDGWASKNELGQNGAKEIVVGDTVRVTGKLYVASNGMNTGTVEHMNKVAVVERIISGANAGYLVKGSGIKGWAKKTQLKL